MTNKAPTADLVNLARSAVRVSAKLAQASAEAATGEPQPVRDGETALQELVRHSSTAAGSLLGQGLSALREGAGVSTHAQDANTADAPLPRVSPGSTLCLPLSITNPGTSPMNGVTPTLVGLSHENGEDTSAPKLRFEPAELSIAPHDFEKLVVYVDVPAAAAAGQWVCTFVLSPPDAEETVFRFMVS